MKEGSQAELWLRSHTLTRLHHTWGRKTRSGAGPRAHERRAGPQITVIPDTEARQLFIPLALTWMTPPQATSNFLRVHMMELELLGSFEQRGCVEDTQSLQQVREGRGCGRMPAASLSLEDVKACPSSTGWYTPTLHRESASAAPGFKEWKSSLGWPLLAFASKMAFF